MNLNTQDGGESVDTDEGRLLISWQFWAGGALSLVCWTGIWFAIAAALDALH